MLTPVRKGLLKSFLQGAGARTSLKSRREIKTIPASFGGSGHGQPGSNRPAAARHLPAAARQLPTAAADPLQEKQVNKVCYSL